MKNTNIPVMGHADGVCHTFIDESAKIDMAVDLVVDSKTQYVVACNTLETLLVHEKIAEQFLPFLKEALEKKDVLIKGCEKVTEDYFL